MSTWVYIRGWLEFYGQKAEAEQIIRRGDPAGWAFPEGGWLDAACYARAVRPQYSDDVLEWQIRDGQVQVGQAPARYDYLWQ